MIPLVLTPESFIAELFVFLVTWPILDTVQTNIDIQE